MPKNGVGERYEVKYRVCPFEEICWESLAFQAPAKMPNARVPSPPPPPPPPRQSTRTSSPPPPPRRYWSGRPRNVVWTPRAPAPSPPPICWCGDGCKIRKSKVEYEYVRRYFCCANYAHDREVDARGNISRKVRMSHTVRMDML